MLTARGAYFAARYDAKARVEANNFLRHYGCSLICEQCLASKISKTTDDRMCYKDFRLESPRWMTRINHDTYMRTTPPRAISPWHIIPGWSLESCLHDIMHVVYLGTGRDLVASLLGDFLECGVLGSSDLSVDHRLRLFSIEMNKFFKSEKYFAQSYQIFPILGTSTFRYLIAFKDPDFYLPLVLSGSACESCSLRPRTRALEPTQNTQSLEVHGKLRMSKCCWATWHAKLFSLLLKRVSLVF